MQAPEVAGPASLAPEASRSPLASHGGGGDLGAALRRLSCEPGGRAQTHVPRTPGLLTCCCAGAEPARVGTMVKYFLGQSVLRSSWDQVFAAFWQRYPNPYR